jgi:hypothetical protein
MAEKTATEEEVMRERRGTERGVRERKLRGRTVGCEHNAAASTEGVE